MDISWAFLVWGRVWTSYGDRGFPGLNRGETVGAVSGRDYRVRFLNALFGRDFRIRLPGVIAPPKSTFVVFPEEGSARPLVLHTEIQVDLFSTW